SRGITSSIKSPQKRSGNYMPRTTCERRLGPDAPIRQPQAATRSSNPLTKIAELLLETARLVATVAAAATCRRSTSTPLERSARGVRRGLPVPSRRVLPGGGGGRTHVFYQHAQHTECEVRLIGYQ